MRSIALALAVICGSISYAQVSIIPQPASLKTSGEVFSLTSTSSIVYQSKDLLPSATFLQSYINKTYKLNLKISSGPATKSSIVLTLLPAMQTAGGNTLQIYSLNIQPKSFQLGGTSPEAVFNGVQTIIQLLPLKTGAVKIPCVQIEDEPRFAYRGLHLDVGRHFMPIDFIKKYIDYIALHKMNYFHWHLTEDQGWRIEIKKYPKLTQVGAWRNGTIIGRHPGTGNDNKKDGGFYTQEQVKEIVKYAAERYITIVPEIEMPGHGSAAIAAYPFLSCFPEEPTKKYFPKNGKWAGDSTGKQVQQAWGVYSDVFCAGKEETFKFLQDIVDEVIPLFPGKYFHVGGDECPKENWKRCSNCQKRRQENNLKDEHELQSYFIQRMEKYINGKGKTIIGWDEILEGGLAPNAIVMSWRGEAGGIQAAKENHSVIMSPGNPVYFDHSQTDNEDSVTIGGYNPIEKVYAYEPIPAALNAEQGKFVMGAQANMWTEYMTNPKKVEYMLFPRLSALSEVLWSQQEKKNWNDFEKRLQVQFKRYDLWKANYSRAYYDLKATVAPTENFDGVLWKLETKNPAAEIKTITHSAGKPYESKFNEGTKYTSPLIVKSTQLVAAISMINGKAVSNPLSQTFLFNKATGKKVTLAKAASKNYPGDGAFTLVNGVQNTMGRGRSKEFLGFNGEDCEAIIDLGKEDKFSSVTIHSFRQQGSWIYQPISAEVFISRDGTNFSSVGMTKDFKETRNGNGVMKVDFTMTAPVRYVKVVVKNWGDIQPGNPGAGNKAWLFVDEIEVN
ncbi:MAG TPA: family 20 glycosylhydrolase [Chitinophagaceae bacterium]